MDLIFSELPKSIHIEIFCFLPLHEFFNLSLTSKNINSIIKKNFWKSYVLKNYELPNVLKEELLKSENWKEYLLELMRGWDPKISNQTRLIFEGKKLTHKKKYGMGVAHLKKTFITGKENYLFVFDLHANKRENCATGICPKDNNLLTDWLHDGTSGFGAYDQEVKIYFFTIK